MFKSFVREETLNYLCCQFDGEGFHSFKVYGGLKDRKADSAVVIVTVKVTQGQIKTVPNETSYVTSYMSIMVTNPLSCTIFEI